MNQLEDYLQRSGDTVEDMQYNQFLIENDHGFATYSFTTTALILYNVYGDGEYWDKYFYDLAKQHGKEKVMFGTKRNYKAFERKFGYKRVGYILEKEVI